MVCDPGSTTVILIGTVDGDCLPATTATATWTSTCRYDIRLDGGAWFTYRQLADPACAATYTWSTIALGTHTFEVWGVSRSTGGPTFGQVDDTRRW